MRDLLDGLIQLVLLIDGGTFGDIWRRLLDVERVNSQQKGRRTGDTEVILGPIHQLLLNGAL
jgi:hypothetical protein